MKRWRPGSFGGAGRWADDWRLLAFVEAALRHSVIGGYERGVFVVVLVIGCVFEAAWQITRGTNAMI